MKEDLSNINFEKLKLRQYGTILQNILNIQISKQEKTKKGQDLK